MKMRLMVVSTLLIGLACCLSSAWAADTGTRAVRMFYRCDGSWDDQYLEGREANVLLKYCQGEGGYYYAPNCDNRPIEAPADGFVQSFRLGLGKIPAIRGMFSASIQMSLLRDNQLLFDGWVNGVLGASLPYSMVMSINDPAGRGFFVCGFDIRPLR
jgi:hypothetical protein